MTDDKVEPVPNEKIVIIGTGDGSKTIPPGMVVVTPGHLPNIVFKVISPAIAILIRFINVYLGVLVGTLLGALGTGVIPASDFFNLLGKCASLSLCGPFVLMLKDIGTVFLGLEKKFPLMTGSV